MELVFGGAYQGKLEYIKARCGLDGGSVYYLKENSLEIPDRKVLSGFHIYVLSLIGAGKKPSDEIKKLVPSLDDKIILADDISCGVVPIDERFRFWREENGRCLSFLASKADRVVRVFCGIGTVLK